MFRRTNSKVEDMFQRQSSKTFRVTVASRHIICHITNIPSKTFRITFRPCLNTQVSKSAWSREHAVFSKQCELELVYAAPVASTTSCIPTATLLQDHANPNQCNSPLPPAPHYQIQNGGCGRSRGCAERRPWSAREDSEVVCWCLACQEPAPSRFIRASNPRYKRHNCPLKTIKGRCGCHCCRRASRRVRLQR